jgi:signal transduction protein with GAF and PtsI domain
MTDEPSAGGAEETIARLSAEIDGLRRELEGERFAGELRRALSLAAGAGVIASPVKHSRLLEMIVATAAHVISAQAASLFLIDEASQELVFEVALGQKGEAVKKFRVPLGKGIAGLVAVTGQPMAVSNVQEDPRHATDIAKSVGYQPKSILCVPLYYEDQVIGVLELLDKVGAPSFSAADTAALGLFANQAAVAIEQSRAYRNITALLGEVLSGLDRDPAQADKLGEGMASFASDMEDDQGYRRALDLARLVQEIAWRGEREATLCRSVLEGFAGYIRSRPDYSGLGSF